MKAKLVFAVVVALCVTTADAYGDIFNATNRGRWTGSGASNNGGGGNATRSYQAWETGVETSNLRPYFVFDRSNWAGSHVVSGNFLITNPNGGGIGAPVLELYEFLGNITTLTTATGGGAAVFADLGDGLLYGSGATPTNATSTISLNGDALDAIRNGTGLFAFGGALNNAPFTTAFNNTTGAGFLTQLDLTLVANQAPVADAGGPYLINIFSDLALNGAGSFDPDAGFGDSIVAWDWDVDGDGTFDFTGESLTVIWDDLVAAGIVGGNTYDLTLRVTDESGAEGFDVTPFTVNAAVPEPATCLMWALAGGSCGIVNMRRRRKAKQQLS